MKYGYYEYKKGRWQVYFTHEGKQIHLTRSLYCDEPLTSEKDCQILINFIKEHGFDEERFGIKEKAFVFDTAVQTWQKLSTCSLEWKKQREQISNRFFIPFFKKRDIRTIKTVHIQEFRLWLEAKGYSAQYVKNVLSELRAFLRFNRKSIPELPEFVMPVVQEKPINWLTEEEQDRVFQFIPEVDLPIFTFMKTFGCRENEAAGLLRRNVFLGHNPPYVVLETVLGNYGELKPTTKTKKIKVLPVPSDLLWIFKPTEATQFVFSKGGKPYSNKRLVTVWNRANKESGVKPCNLYNAMRHSFGMQRLNQGYSLDEVRAVMGHGVNSRCTDRYAKYLPETLLSVVQGRGYKKVIDLPNSQSIELSKVSKIGRKVEKL